MKNEAAYKRCLDDSKQIAMKRFGHDGESEILSIKGECKFAEWAGISTSAIRAATSNHAIFTFRNNLRVVVKTTAFDPESPRRRVSLFVPKKDIYAKESHVYVLWSVGWRTPASHPVGWATHFDVERATVGSISKSESYLCHIVPQSQLRSMSTLTRWCDDLKEKISNEIILDWWIDKMQAAVRVNGVAMGIVYFGASGWHASGADGSFKTARDAAMASLPGKPMGNCAWPW